MYRIAVCEDNPIQRELISDMLSDYETRSHTNLDTDLYPDGDSLIQVAETGRRYDLYLLDVMMPGLNGIETADRLRELHEENRIIFLTAEPGYAVDSYRVHAYYYLLKPAVPEQLYAILDRAFADIRKDGNRILSVKSKGGENTISADDVLYAILSDRHVRFFLQDNRVLEGRTIRSTFLDAVEELLDTGHFVACGVSNAVNVARVKEITRDDEIIFDTGARLYLSRQALADLKRARKS